VGDGVTVPWFPGRGGRRTNRAVADLPYGVKRIGTGERRSYSALPVPGVPLSIIAQMFYSTRGFIKTRKILRFLIFDTGNYQGGCSRTFGENQAHLRGLFSKSAKAELVDYEGAVSTAGFLRGFWKCGFYCMILWLTLSTPYFCLFLNDDIL
jgi:hypothetical protein